MADDIKVKLGIEVGELFANLDKVVNKLNEVGRSANTAETEIGQIDDQKIDIDTAPAKQSLDNLGKDAQGIGSKLKESFSGANLGAGLVGGLAGGLASAGIGAAVQGVQALGKAIFDGAVRADEFGDKLEVAFKQQGVKDIAGEIDKVRASSLALANDLGLPVERTRELAGTVAQLGGVTGKQAEDLTKLSAGIETFTDGTVKGEAVAKAFSRGLADPEGAAAIEALSKKYPQLAETLKSNLDPTEKLAAANKILGTSFETVAAQQGDAGGTFNKLSNAVSEAFEAIGGAINDVINTLIPLFTNTLGPAFADLSNSATGYFEKIWSVVGPILGLIGGAITVTISNIIQVAIETLNSFYEIAVYAFDGVVNALQPLITAIKSALGMDGAIGEGVDAVEVLQSIMSGFSDVIGAVFDVITKLGKVIIDVLIASFTGFINIIVAVGTAIVEFGKYIGNLILQIPGVTTVMNGLRSAFETVYNFFANLPEVINDVQIYLKAIGYTFQSIFGILKESFDAALNLDFGTAANKLASVFESSTWVNAFSSNLQKARSELKETTGQVAVLKKSFDDVAGEKATIATPKAKSGTGKAIAKEVKDDAEKELKEKPINVKVVLGGENDKELQSQLKTVLSGLEKESGTIQTSLEKLVPEIGAKTQEELDSTIAQYESYVAFIKQQSLEIEEARNIAIGLGDEKAQQQLDNIISYNNQALEATKTSLKKYTEESAKTIGNNTLGYQVQNALQTSFLDVFNSDKIRKEKETNEAIKKERLDSLNAEEKDLNKSLAKREISAEEYAAKLADINKGREDAESKTNNNALKNLKRVGDQTAASVLKSQGDIFKKNAEKMEGNEKVFNEFVGNTLNQFSVLAASGTATLADFGAAAAGAAFDAVAAMIPSFVTGILGTSIITLGPILGPLAAASLTGVLYGLLGLARSAAGFKDGVVGLHGEGTETSDSIPAWLSRGESVITARATSNNREELEFMNNTGLSIAEFYKMRMPSTSVSVTPDGDLIREVRKLREETRGLGVRIQRNTSVEVSGVLTADSNSINAMIVQQKRRSARRG
jgi:hypothetical protein